MRRRTFLRGILGAIAACHTPWSISESVSSIVPEGGWVVFREYDPHQIVGQILWMGNIAVHNSPTPRLLKVMTGIDADA